MNSSEATIIAKPRHQVLLNPLGCPSKTLASPTPPPLLYENIFSSSFIVDLWTLNLFTIFLVFYIITLT